MLKLWTEVSYRRKFRIFLRQNWKLILNVLNTFSSRSQSKSTENGFLVLIPSLFLPPNCSQTLIIKSSQSKIYETCQTQTSPIILPIQHPEIKIIFQWVEDLKKIQSEASSSSGFQMSVMSVPRETQMLIEILINRNNDWNGFNTFSRDGNSAMKKLLQTMLEFRQVNKID